MHSNTQGKKISKLIFFQHNYVSKLRFKLWVEQVPWNKTVANCTVISKKCIFIKLFKINIDRVKPRKFSEELCSIGLAVIWSDRQKKSVNLWYFFVTFKKPTLFLVLLPFPAYLSHIHASFPVLSCFSLPLSPHAQSWYCSNSRCIRLPTSGAIGRPMLLLVPHASHLFELQLLYINFMVSSDKECQETAVKFKIGEYF